MKSVTKYILASLLITILTLSLFGLHSLNQYHDREVKNASVRLEACIRTFWQLLDPKGQEFRIVNGKLLLGNYTLNGNFELPDRVQDIFGGVATIFMGDERVSTNVLNAEGQRAVGTKLTGPAYDAVFKQEKPYRGTTTILGIPYLTAYDPITDKDGKVIGALFVGVKESDLLASMHAMRSQLTMTMFSMLTVLTFLMVLMGLAMKRVEDVNENQIQFQSTLMNTIPSPIFYKDEAGRYLGCNTAFEAYVGFSQNELLGKTPHELWPEELADHYRQQDLNILENPGMRTYETSVRYADGTLRDVIFNKATFSGKDGLVAGLVGVILDITERKQTEDTLALQNILLSTQQEASIDGILVVDEHSKILSCNRRFAEIMDIPAQLLEAKDDEPVLRHVTGLMADPHGFIEKINYLYKHRQESCRDEIALSDGTTLDRYTVPLLGLDGRYYGRLWSFRDVTERKAAEEQTKSSYQQLLDIVEFLPDATFVTDMNKRVIAWNRAIEKMTGLNKADVIGEGDFVYSIPFYGERRPILIDLIDEDLDQIRQTYDYITLEGRTLFAETFIPNFRGGADCYLWATATPLFDRHGNQVGSIESIRDITGYKRTEDEKIRLESQIAHTRLMETIMARLGHDLKTPLTPLFILLPLLKKQLNEPELIKKVDACIKSAVTINNLAEKTRTLANLSSRNNLLVKESSSLAALVDHSQDNCRDIISHKQIVCQNIINPAMLVHVVPGQLHELFSNLISNAVHFSQEQSVITISAEQQGGMVRVSVQDTGIGIAPNHRDHIFDEFYKADESRHDLETSGLGLSICKQIVRNHNGRIWAESPGLGQGTTINFTINEQDADQQHG